MDIGRPWGVSHAGSAWAVVADFHTHTRHSHGSGSVLDNALAARSRGLRCVGITDHGPANLLGVGVSGPDELVETLEEARTAEVVCPGVRVLAGVEANVISPDGRLDVPEHILARLDLVLAACHLFVRRPGAYATVATMVRNAASCIIGGVSPRVVRRARADNTKALVEAVLRGRVHIVAHPGRATPVDISEIARACAARGTLVEINAMHRGQTPEFLQKAAREGADFAVSSDAHSPGRIGDVAWAVQLARTAGIPATRIVNVAAGATAAAGSGGFAWDRPGS